MIASWPLFAALGLSLVLGSGEAAAQANCAAMRKINIGVSVSPPNVVHTTPYVAKELGLFAKHCIDANIIQFDGGESPAARPQPRPGHHVGQRQRRRGRPRHEGAAGLGPGAAPPQAYVVPAASRPRPTSRASGCARPAAASAASTGGWAARC